MSGLTELLPGLLDDPQVQSTELPTLTNFRIAPLRNPAPSRNSNVPSPLEPLAGSAVRSRSKTQHQHSQEQEGQTRKGTPKITPSDVILAWEEKKPNLTIRELVEASTDTNFEPTQLPSFVSLAVVERSPVQRSQVLDLERAQKRLRLDNGTESGGNEVYRLLPRPEQNDSKPPVRPLPMLPAMVAGLHEPPQSAALLPSMDPQSLSKTSVENASATKMKVGRVLETTETKSHTLPPELMLNSPEMENADLPEAAGSPIDDFQEEDTLFSENTASRANAKTKTYRRAPRKWSDEETEQLMAGVEKYGIGKWKQILNDPGSNFNERSTVDLKDRFRVCQPRQYRLHKKSKAKDAEKPLSQFSPNTMNTMDNQARSQESQALPERDVSDDLSITNDSLRETLDYGQAESPDGTPGAEVAKKGKSTPPQSPRKRRKRCPWTMAEDEALMKGVAHYGFQWTSIHHDTDLNLSHRKATDLRDRIRNKFPDAYKHADTAPLRAERTKESRTKSNDVDTTQALADAEPTKSAARRGKRTKTDATTTTQNGGDTSQEHSGLKLPPLTLDAGEWDWENNTLPPLLDWEEIGL